MTHPEFQVAYSRLNSLGDKLATYLAELKAGLEQQGDSTADLSGIAESISRSLDCLQNHTYQVAVIAAMKAGKSTFLNAMIGTDILASESASCTVCRTEIRHVSNAADSELLEYRSGSRHPISLAKGDARSIQTAFLHRTREIRERNNPDQTVNFELRHPIAAIQGQSFLSGLALIDTPGPNEWESAGFEANKLKETTLKAVRNCNAILFLLDYTSYKDNAITGLFQELIESRKEFLREKSGRLYFILNKIDQRGEKDPPLEETIALLKRELEGFGFDYPQVYAASSRKGLLAKMILAGTESPEVRSDFIRFFSAAYAIENEEGDLITPSPKKIAPKALEDSGISTIESSVIQEIIRQSGWHLLEEVISALDKDAVLIETLLKTKIAGWNQSIEGLRQLITSYSQKSESAQERVSQVYQKVDAEKEIVIRQFSNGIDQFSNHSREKFHAVIEEIVESRRQGKTDFKGSKDNSKKEKEKKSKTEESCNEEEQVRIEELSRDPQTPSVRVASIVDGLGEGLSAVAQLFNPMLAGVIQGATKVIANIVHFTTDFYDVLEPPLVEIMTKDVGTPNFDPRKIQCKSQDEAKQIEEKINGYFGPYLQGWWLETQDLLIHSGNQVRQEISQSIRQDIQEISNELAIHLGKELKIDMEVTPIQFPDFEFAGIDRLIEVQQMMIPRERQEKKKRKSGGCCSKTTYEIKIIKSSETVYCIDLDELSRSLDMMIDNQNQDSKEVLSRAVAHQIHQDFRSAKSQIDRYIKGFQSQFEELLEYRESESGSIEKIQPILETAQSQISEIRQALHEMREMETPISRQ
ncbi:MAG: dynamin family protein [Oscillatoriales cyanobacterium]|nr:MAG: dynamin family protein [Oscillatoriales cyanobacterium]